MIPKFVVIHCSATPNGKPFTAFDIDAWHKERGWSRCGYHLVIGVDGTVYDCDNSPCRPLNVQGAHVKGHNKNSIGICLIGTDKFTPKQFESLFYHLQAICQLYDIEPKDIRAHNEFAKKKCPGMRIGVILDWFMSSDNKAIKDHLLLG